MLPPYTTVLCDLCQVAMPRVIIMSEQTSSSHGETVRVPADLVEMARHVCFNRRTAEGRRLRLTEYLSAILRGPVTADYQAIQQPRPRKKGGERS